MKCCLWRDHLIRFIWKPKKSWLRFTCFFFKNENVLKRKIRNKVLKSTLSLSLFLSICFYMCNIHCVMQNVHTNSFNSWILRICSIFFYLNYLFVQTSKLILVIVLFEETFIAFLHIIDYIDVVFKIQWYQLMTIWKILNFIDSFCLRITF